MAERRESATTVGSLKGIKVFAPLDAEAIGAIDKRVAWHRFDAGQNILGRLEPSTDVFFVVSGRVRAAAFSASGKQVSYRDIEAGDFFGEFSAIDGEPRSADVTALEQTLVAIMSARTFWALLREQPDVAAATLKRLTGQIRTLTERIYEFSALAVNNRIEAELLRLARTHMRDPNTAYLKPAPTHAEIASRVSCHREAVTRVLNDLARAGLVAREAGGLAVLDLDALSARVERALGE
jgi:CRP-like cAMP-binding protein